MKFKIFNKYLVFITIISNILINHSYSSEQKEVCDNKVIDHIINYSDNEHFQYLEKRKDTGLFFDFKWNSENEEIIIKRDKNNYPILRFSLFEKEKLISGSIIKKINSNDLSKLNDNQIKKITRNDDVLNIELTNNENVLIKPKPYVLNEFKLAKFELNSIQNIDTNFGILEASFEAKLTNIRNDLLQLLKNTGYLSDQLYPICYDARQLHTWPLGSVEFDEFRYDADVREGLKNKEIIINPVFEITYDNGKVRSLRTEKGVGFFRQSFDFKKFPFDKQKLLIRINSGVSNLQDSNQNHNEAGQVTFITPEAGPFLDLEKFINPDTNKLKAWNIKNDGIKISSKELISPEYNIWSGKIYNKSTNVLDIEIEINRNYEHYLFKIILPVFLILCVAWYVLWIPTEKYEARLNTSMIALLALIAYNFVFQDDIPKLEYLTDLDWFILLSYIFCCIPVFLSIGFSKFLVKNQKLVILINKRIRSFGLLIYFIITLQIFYGI